MLRQVLRDQVIECVRNLWGYEVDITGIEVNFSSDPKFGDVATNAAMVMARRLSKPPRELAELLARKLAENQQVVGVEVAGPGFVNITLSDACLVTHTLAKTPRPLAGKVIVTEYSDPNPFKVLHAGHFYTSVVGDAISNLLEHAGATVHRVNFGGDVGLHVGKTMWAIIAKLGGEHPEKLGDIPVAERSEWMAACYVEGTQAYETDETAKTAIVAMNKRVYQLHTDTDHATPFAKIYWTCRQWSYEYFNAFYAQIGSGFERYYPESETAAVGLETVKRQLEAGVFTRSDGAVVFKGEPYGLHTRVFINGDGLPTYEAKDVGLSIRKWADYQFDSSVIITGNDIIEYMKVVLKAIEQFEPELARRTKHITHGNVKLAGGVKMSSRKGNFLRAVDVIEAANAASHQPSDQAGTSVLAAIKYSFLKSRIGSDIIFIPEESVALEGNSGPYLQYAHARARSILRKLSQAETLDPHTVSFDAEERILAAKLAAYGDVVADATQTLLPHVICTYLYELTQAFNRFYEHNRVAGDGRESVRAGLVMAYAEVLREGLSLLGIDAPERM